MAGRALHDEHNATANLFNILSDDVLETCFSFLGNHCYRFIAGTSRRFRHIYQHYGNRLGKHPTTLWKHAVCSSSIACAQLCLSDYQQQNISNDKLKVVVNKLLCEAIMLGSPANVLEWARLHGGECNDWRLFRIAAARGHVHVLEWANSRQLNWSSPAILYEAAYHGHVEVLEFAYQHGDARHFDNTGSFAARGGHVSVLQWMKKRSLLHKYNWHVWYEAAHHGHTHILDWLVNQGYKPDSTILSGAAKGGHVQVLEWGLQHANSLRWSCKVCAHAAYHGHLHVLQWLRRNECPWDGNVLYWALRGNHSHVLEWAQAQDCPTESEEIFEIDRFV